MKTNSAKYIATAFSLMILTLLVLPFGAHALSNTYTPLAPLPDLSTLQPKTSVNISDYIQYMFNLLIAVGAVAAVFEITWGGFEYMTSDAVSGKSAGVEKIKNAIYGLLLVLSSYLILETIDPRLVKIPSSLVDPIQSCTNGQTTGCVNTTYDSTSVKNSSSAYSSAWTDNISKQLDSFNNQSTDAKKTINDMATKNASLISDNASVADQIKSLSGEDPSVSCYTEESFNNSQLNSLCTTWQNNQDQIQTNVKTGSQAAAVTQFDSLANLATTDVSRISKADLDSANSLYLSTIAEMRASGASTQDIQSLQDSYTGMDASVNLGRLSSNHNITADTGMTYIDTTMSDILSMSDSSVKQSTINSTISTIDAYVSMSDNGAADSSWGSKRGELLQDKTKLQSMLKTN